MSDNITEDEARKEAYDMAFDRFEPMKDIIPDKWENMSEDERSEAVIEGFSHWKEGATFANIVAPNLRDMARQLAENHESGGSDDMTLVSWMEGELFGAFGAGAHDAYSGRERYESLD